MAYTTATVNTWFQTIDGLPSTTVPITPSIADAYVVALNTGISTPAEVQAGLENYPFNPSPPPTNFPTSMFGRTTVADFVLREFQAAWGVVPTSGAGSEYSNWEAAVLANPSLTLGGMSESLAGTTAFMDFYGVDSATEPATVAFVTQMMEQLLGIPPGPGALAANVGLPVWQVLQNFVTNPTVIARMDAPIANFQNLLLAGETPTGSIFALPGTGGTTFTLTSGVDSPTTGFLSGNGATATAAGSEFIANPVSNGILGVTNSLQAGDNLQAVGAAAGASTLTDNVINSFINGPLAVAVTMNGVSTLNILNSATATAGFSGNITGLTTVEAATNGFPITLGSGALGLNTALSDITLNTNFTDGSGFTAWMTPAAITAAIAAGTDTATVDLTGVAATVHLNVTGTSTIGYESLTVDSGGSGPNDLILDIHNATNTATITATGAEFLTISGSALNIANLHTFDGTAAAGGFEVFFNGFGPVAATGDAASTANDTFVFTTGAGDAGNFSGSGSTVTGGGGADNTLVIQADNGTILAAGDNPGITDIATIVHETVAAGGANGALTADLTGLNPATVFDLAGAYDTQTISVTDIDNAQTVEFSGSGGHLTLAAPTPLGLDAQINLQLSGDSDLTQLTVALGLDSLNVHGLDGGGTIANVSTVHDSVNIDGDSFVAFGTSFAGGFTFVNPTEFLGGVIDAHTDTGGVSTFLPQVWGANGAANTLPANDGWVQTFIGGTGGNSVNVDQFGGDLINFSAGPGTAEFNVGNYNSGHLLSNPPQFQYNQVGGFTAS